jgi:hypothetical protein
MLIKKKKKKKNKPMTGQQQHARLIRDSEARFDALSFSFPQFSLPQLSCPCSG